eukprot:751930-Pyramimonas_sp.AAC.1
MTLKNRHRFLQAIHRQRSCEGTVRVRGAQAGTPPPLLPHRFAQAVGSPLLVFTHTFGSPPPPMPYSPRFQHAVTQT